MKSDPSDREAFDAKCNEDAVRMASSSDIRDRSLGWVIATAPYRYVYNFRWAGLPVIQFPQDIIALQEIIWETRPDLIIETGVARGGSVMFYASMLELLGGEGRVLGIDIDIRPHNRRAIESHVFSPRVDLIEASSTDRETVEKVQRYCERASKVMVVLDSHHTHAHVLSELESYSRFVTTGCYLVVLDTIIEDMPVDAFPDRPWGPSNNPNTAVREFLATTDRFEVDKALDNKLLISVAPGGYLRCIK